MWYLALSGFIGLVIGDQALLTAFLYVGPRLAVLVTTTAPLFAALFGWLAFHETLAPSAWLGMWMTIAGVAWVILERRRSETIAAPTHLGWGVSLALLAAACQAGGLMLSKKGMGHGWLSAQEHLAPQSATLVRMIFAALGMIPLLWIRGLREQRRRRVGLTVDPTASSQSGYGFAFCGAIVGPYLGVWMSLIATDRAPVGVAQTLCSLPPVLILPFAAWLYKEPITLRTVIGAVVAIAGCTLLVIDRAVP